MKKNIDERYDNRFISLYGIASSKTIEYKKEKIDILAIGLSFRLFDIKTNKEVLFNQYPFIDEQIGMLKRVKIYKERKFMVNTPVYLTDCVQVYVTKKKLCKYQIKKRLLKKLGFVLKIKTFGFYFDNNYEDNMRYSETIEDLEECRISREKFKDILKNNIDFFTTILDNEYKGKTILNLPVEYNINFKEKVN